TRSAAIRGRASIILVLNAIPWALRTELDGAGLLTLAPRTRPSRGPFALRQPTDSVRQVTSPSPAAQPFRSATAFPASPPERSEQGDSRAPRPVPLHLRHPQTERDRSRERSRSRPKSKCLPPVSARRPRVVPAPRNRCCSVGPVRR